MKKAPTGKELLQATALVSLIVMVAALIANRVGSQLDQKREAEGVQASATVSDKRRQWESSGGRGGSMVNVFTVMYFDSVETQYATSEIAEGVELTLPSGVEFGDFHSADIIRVPDDTFRTTNEGDSVEIIFLPEDPERVWLLETVENYSPWDGYIFAGIFLVIAIVCLYFSRRFP